MSSFISNDQYDNINGGNEDDDGDGWDDQSQDGFATSSFASMPSAPKITKIQQQKTEVDSEHNNDLNVSDFFMNDEEEDEHVNTEIFQSEKYKYQNIYVLGRGAFATCFLSKRNDNLYVCVKKLDNNLKHISKEEKAKIFGEIQALKAVSAHENVTHLYESFETKGHVLHICLEYCCGNTLADLIQETLNSNELLSDQQIKEYSSQIFTALKHIHSQKIIHRDMKPANILLTGENGRFLKIADFGISKLSAATMAMSIVGTPYYLAPELCEGHEYGYKADLWATGIILYEMCNLKRPFDASSLPALIMKIMQVEYEPIFTKAANDNNNNNCTYDRERLTELTHSLLNKLPEDRPSAIDCCGIMQEDIKLWEKEKKNVVTDSLRFAQTYAKEIEAVTISRNSTKSRGFSIDTNSTVTMKTASSFNSSISSSSYNVMPINNNSKTLYQTPRNHNNNNMNNNNNNTNSSSSSSSKDDSSIFSPFEARDVREKMSAIIANHPRLWRVGSPNPKLLHQFLHINIDKLIFGGNTSEEVEDFGSPNENSVIILPKYEKQGKGKTNEAGFLGFGINKSHQLGFDSNGREVKETMPEHICKDFVNIKTISSGDGFSAMIDDDGKLFLYGDFSWVFEVNDLGLCNSLKKEDRKEKEVVADDNPFRSGSSLNDMSFDSTSSKKIMKTIKGDEGNDEMDNSKYSSIPLNVSSIVNHKITNVACGSNFVILLDENGYCHSFGNGDEGVLGLGDGDDRSKPTLIESISNIVDIKCGGRHVLAKSKNNGVLYSWGSDTYGQLGLGAGSDDDDDDNDDDDDGLVPRQISKFKGVNILQFECGLWHSAVISGDGGLYTWGMNESGQCGLGKSFVGTVIDVPTVNEFFEDEDEAVINVGCGAFHTACITEGNLLYGFGSNKQHAIGQKDTDKNYPTPKLIKSLCSRKYIGKSVVSKVFCGIHRTYVLADVSGKEDGGLIE